MMADDIVVLRADRENLHQRVKELLIENERLRSLAQNNAHSWDAIVRERDELREEVKKLHGAVDTCRELREYDAAEITRLRKQTSGEQP